MKLIDFILNGPALSVLILPGISQGQTNRELATDSQASQEHSETTQKPHTATEQPKTKLNSPDQVLDWKTLGASIAALPENQRRTALKQLDTSGFSAADRRNYVKLLRELLPQAEQADVLGYLVSKMPPANDYASITALLDDIQATPMERAVATRAAAGSQLEKMASKRKVTQQDLDTMRLWLKKQDPAAMDRVTGEAIGQALTEAPDELLQDAGNFTFTDAYMLLVSYPASKGNDDLISGFIKVVAEGRVDPRAICVAGKIQDPALLKEALDSITQAFARHPW